MNVKHQSRKIVSSILENIISSVVAAPEMTDDNMEIITIDEESCGEAGKISDYERARNKRVAELRAEFEKQFPSFEQDVRDLRVVKTTLPKRKKKNLSIPARKSSRIKDQIDQPSELAAELSVVTASKMVDDQGEGLVMEGGDINAEAVSKDVEDALVDSLVTGEGEAGDSQELGKFVCLPCGMAFR